MKYKVTVVGVHPQDGYSMRRYAHLLVVGWRDAGAEVNFIYPRAFVARLLPRTRYAKYVDKYVIFAPQLALHCLRRRMVHLADHSDAVYALVAPRTERWLVTIHDLIAVRSARGEITEHRPRLPGRILQGLILRGLRRIPNLLAVSQASMVDAQRLIGTARLLHNPVDPTFWVDSGNRPLSRNSSDFVLVAPEHWRKNRSAGLELWRHMADELGFSESRLHVVGNSLSIAERGIFSDRPELLARVIVHESVSDQELRDLYMGAAATINPSLHEGFGWPIVEGNASGCAAICLDTPVFREVAGEGALLFSTPSSAEARAIAGTLTTNSSELRSAAIENARRFAWPRFSERLEALMREIAA